MLKRIWFFASHFLKPHLLWLAASFGTGLVAASASGMGIPLMVKYVFPLLFPSERGEVPELLRLAPWLGELSQGTLLFLACAMMPLIFIIRGVAMWSNAMVVNCLGIRILETLRMEVFERVQALPIAFLEGRRKGDLISRIVADTQNVQNILTQVSNELIKQPFTCVCALSAFIWLLISSGQGLLFFVNLLFIGAAAWPIVIFGRRISRKSQKAQEGLGVLNSIVQQNLETQREVRAYAMEERQIADFAASSDDFCRNSIKLVKYQRALIPLMEIVTSLALSFLLVRGRLCGMNLTDFISVAAALYFSFDSMKRAGTAFNRIHEAQGSLIRLEEILREPNTMPDPTTPRLLPERVKGDITFRHVSFAYAEEGRPVLRDVDVHIPAGQIVGLVGPSGAGKTTFASLIPRFYDVSEGAVLIDGMDVREVSCHALRQQMALVGQQALLFSGTIRENIALGRPDASEEDILRATEAAAVSKFLDSQPQGLETQLGEGGAGLSGGQRQRVAIARAFVKDAPILILDEATASLDAESEKEIQRELDSLAQGRTTLIVAHRFSTLRHAHRILVFDHGRIVGDGSHAELYDTCPLYRELYDRQGVES